MKIGDEVMRRLRRDEDNASLLWSIGRLGARTPIYGPLTSVVAASDAGRWLEELIANQTDTPELFAAIVQIGALTGDPLRDLDEHVLEAARQSAAERGRRSGRGAAVVRDRDGDVCRHEPRIRRAAAERVAAGERC